MTACLLDGFAGTGFGLVDFAFVAAVLVGALVAVVRRNYTALVVIVLVALVGGVLLLGR